MKQFLLIAAYLCLSGVSCKKLQLTRPTEKGANTFSCIIDSKVFKPCKGGLFGIQEPLTGHVNITSGIATVTINASCTDEEPFKYINIGLDNFQGVGTYSLSEPNNGLSYHISYPIDKRYSSYLTGDGKITITKDDRTNYILSGTFECTVANTNNASEKITIKSGRFDISYK